MIGFSSPWLLAALIPLAGLWFFLMPSRRRTAIRCLTVALLLVALAQPTLSRRDSTNSVLFLVDRSASVSLTQPFEEIQEAIRDVVRANPDWDYGMIAFADGASTVASLGHLTLPVELPILPDQSTDLATAVDLALTALVSAPAPQIVLVTDGRLSQAQMAALDTLQQSGIPVSVLPVGNELQGDLAVDAFHAPAEVAVNRPFQLEVRTASSGEGEASLAVYRNDELIAAEQISVIRGVNTWTLTDTIRTQGSHTYRAIVRLPGDPVTENDTMSTLISTTDRPEVLLVDPSGESAIPSLLQAAQLSFATAESVPSLETLAQHRQLILTGLPLAGMPDEDVARLHAFVRDLGGGLLVVEGESEARGLRSGGIEDLLPVSFTLPEAGQEASQAIAFLLDRSASMQARITGGIRKIEVLKEATAASLRLFDPQNLVGIVAFNREFEWLLPLSPLGTGTEAYDALGPLDAEGGTDIYYPILAALDALDAVDARSKHILLVSDGKTTDEVRDFPRLLSRLRATDGLTFTAIAVGHSPNLQLLGAITQAGGGSLYRAEDFANLPQVTLEAAQRLTSSRFVTEPSIVSGQLLQSLASSSDVPPIGGHLATHAKAAASIHLWAGEDPLLASWRIGLGSVAALNTDLAGAWSSDWLAWPAAAELFEAVVSLTEPGQVSAAGLTPVVTLADRSVSILIDARRDDGTFANFLRIDGHLLPGSEEVPIEQVGPGLYAAQLPALEEGGYALRIDDRDRNRGMIVPFTLPYPEEFRATGIDEAVVVSIAQRTGGVMLRDGLGLTAFDAQGDAGSASWVWLAVLLALGLFLLDLLVRKLPRRAG